MIACPNKTSPDWVALEASVGRFEAVKDWIETGTIRTPEQVMRKINTRYYKIGPGESPAPTLTFESAQSLFNFLQERFGVQGNIINDPSKLWKGSLVDGTTPTINLAYANTSDGFHEYAHAFLMSLRKYNPELFGNLYNQLNTTKEWKDVSTQAHKRVREKYGELSLDDAREEVLATAIGYAASAKYTSLSDKFKKIITSILYWIKSLFNIANRLPFTTASLDVNTTLGQVLELFTNPNVRTDLADYYNLPYTNESILQSLPAQFADEISGVEIKMQELREEAKEAMAELSALGPEMKALNSDINQLQKLVEEHNNLEIKLSDEEQYFIDREAAVVEVEAKEYELDAEIARHNERVDKSNLPDKIKKLVKVSRKPYKPRVKRKFKGKEGAVRDLLLDSTRISSLLPEYDKTVVGEILDSVSYTINNYLETKQHYNSGLESFAHSLQGLGNDNSFKIFREGERIPVTSKFLEYLKINPSGKTQLDKPFSLSEATDYEKEVLKDFYHSYLGDIQAFFAKQNKPVPKSIDNKRLTSKLEKWIQDRYGIYHFSSAGTNGYNDPKTKLFSVDTPAGYEVNVSTGFLTSSGHTYTLTYKNQDGNTVTVPGQNNTLGWYIYHPFLGNTPLVYEFQSDIIDMDDEYLESVFGDIDKEDLVEKIQTDLQNKIQFEKQYNPKKDKQYLKEQIEKSVSDHIERHAENNARLRGVVQTSDSTVEVLASTLNHTINFKFALKNSPYELPLKQYRYIRAGLVGVLKDFSEEKFENKVLKYLTQSQLAVLAKNVVENYGADINSKQAAEHMLRRLEVFSGRTKMKIEQSIASAERKIAGTSAQLATMERGNRNMKVLSKENPLLAQEYNKLQQDRMVGIVKPIVNEVFEMMPEIDVPTEQFKYIEGLKKIAKEAIERVEGEVKEKVRISIVDDIKKLRRVQLELFITHAILYAKSQGKTKMYFPTAELIDLVESGDPWTLYVTPEEKKNLTKYRDEHTGSFYEALMRVPGMNYSYTKPEGIKAHVLEVDLTKIPITGITRFSKLDDNLAPLRPIPVKTDKLSLFKKEIKFSKKVSDLRKNMILRRVKSANQKLSKQLGREVIFGINPVQIGKMDLYELEIVDYRPDSVAPEQPTPSDNKGEQMTLFFRDPSVSTESVKTDPEALNKDAVLESLRKMVQAYADRTGIKYSIITANEAIDLTNGRWKNEKGFFQGDTVYLVRDLFTADTVFHEFSHPFVRAIRQSNPVLFERLYTKAVSTAEGQAVRDQVKVLYSDLFQEESDLFKEEVIVRSMEAHFRNLNAVTKESEGFLKFIKDLLYALKQAFRSVFGQKIQIEKLKVETTIEELAEMLTKGGKLDLRMDTVRPADVIAYTREQSELVDTLKAVDKKDLAARTSKMHDIAINHLRKLKENRQYREIADILANEFEPTELARIKSRLSVYQKTLDEKVDKMINSVEYTANLASATIDSFYHLQVLSSKILDHLNELSKDPDDKNSLQQMAYYQGLINDWRNYLVDVIKTLDKNRISPSNSFYKLTTEIQNNLNNASDRVQSVRKVLLRPVLWNQLSDMAKFIDKQHESGYLSKSAYETLKLTPEKIELMLEGKIGDDHNLNSFLEGYMYNQDPVVAAAAKFINDNYTDVITGTQKDLNTFSKDIKSDLDAIGYTGNDPEALGRQVTYTDEIGFTDDDGKFQTKQVKTFLSPVKNYRAAVAKMTHDIQEARKLPQTEENKKAVRQLEYERDKHMATFFNQPFHPEFYENLALFADEIGQQAREDYDKVRADAEAFRDKMLTSALTDEEVKAGNEAVRRSYQNLYSLKNEDGTLKDELGQEKARRLQSFRDHMSRFFERKTYSKTFRAAYDDYKQKLTDRGLTGEEFENALNKWLSENTVKKVKPEYSETVRLIRDRLAKISAGMGKSHDYFGEMYDITQKFRDENFQINGQEIPDEIVSKIKKWEDLMDDERKSGIFNELPSMVRLEFFGLLDDLRSLRKKVPTSHYLDTFNSFLEKVDLTEFYKTIGSTEINTSNADTVLSDLNLLNSLFKQNSQFEQWFNKSHRRINKFEEGLVTGYSWERSYIWNTTEPVDKSNYESTVLEYDAEGKPVRTIDRIPGFRFSYSSVKSHFIDKNGNRALTLTKKIVGETVDNKGNWLPKSIEQGAPTGSTYINQAYYDLKKNNQKIFTILEKTKKFHLDNQKGIGRQAKLYLDLPRFERNVLETVRSGNAVSVFMKKLRMWLFRSKDDATRGFNWTEVDFNIAKTDYYDEELSAAKVPIYGTAILDPDVLSLDIFRTTTSYMLSAAMHKKRVEMLPTFKALKSVLQDPDNAIKEITGFTEGNELNRGILTYRDKKGRNVRLAAIKALMERELEGQSLTGLGKDIKWVHQVMNVLLSRASFGFFALNAPSALKNSLAAHMEVFIESAAGSYLTTGTYGKGILWAGKLMSQISAQIYEKGPKSLSVQLTEIFDPTRGRQEERFGDSISRTLLRDTVDGSWLYNFRKWTEMHATMSLFGGMMYKQKVEQTVDGKTRQIDYIDAWELNSEGQIQLKEGIDPEWGTTGKKFKEFRETTNTVSKRLQGAYSRFDQPEANRYLLFRMIWYLRKFFIPMFMDRWAFRGPVWDPKPRYDIGSGGMTQGYYITFAKLLAQTAMSVKYGLPKMGAMEKRAAIKMTTEILSLYTLVLLWEMLFDYDPDDEDRFEKLRARSGPFPVPFAIDPELEAPFHLDGWLANHTLATMVMVKAENDQWLPLPGLGLDNYMNTLYLKSFAYGPTIEAYVKMITDLQRMASGDERAYYKRDVGPYVWQKEESAKIWNHLGKSLGLSATTPDPETLLKNTEWMQQPTRR